MDIKSNDPFLISTRNIDKINDSNSIINVYPVVIDKILEKKYADLVRNFVTLSMISQIKVNNVLSIIQLATTINKESKLNYNPIEKIQQNLGYTNQDSTRLTRTDLERDQFNLQNQDRSQYEYQEKINTFLNFIRNQINHDPQYKEFKPFISSITTQNLLNVPLIIGTKLFSIDTSVDYWVLFVAVATSSTLDKYSNVEKIKKFIKVIPKENYMDLFSIKDNFKFPEYLSKSDPDKLADKLISKLFSRLDITLTVYDKFLNESKWNEEVGFGEITKLQINTAIEQTDGIKKQLIQKSRTLFNNFVANELVRIMQSLSYTLMGTTEINLSSKISGFNDKLLEIINPNIEILLNGLSTGLQNAENFEQGETLVNYIKNGCVENSKIGALNILNDIKKIMFSIVPSNDPTRDLVQFIANLNEPSAKLDVFSKELEIKIKETSEYSEGLKNSIVDLLRSGDKGMYGDISKLLIMFFRGLDEGLVGVYTQDPDKVAVGVNTDEKLTIEKLKKYNERMKFYKEIFINPDDERTTEELFDEYFKLIKDTPIKIKLKSSRFDFLTEGSGNLEKYIFSAVNSITQIIYFNILYITYSYFCEYIGEVEIQLEVHKKNALSFPNYTMVIPDIFVRGIYMALASRSFKDLIEKGTEIDPMLKITENDLKRMTNVLSNRLKIPNIIVVDTKKKTLIYKFTYMKEIQKMPISAIESYVNHQSDVISGF